MALRRFLLATALLLLTLSLLSSLSTTSRPERATKPPYTRPSPPSRAAGKLPADERVRARVGDVVVVEVRAPRADTAEVPELGIDVPVAPGVPGRLEFVADRPGRFPVVLDSTGEQLGVVLVTERATSASAPARRARAS